MKKFLLLILLIPLFAFSQTGKGWQSINSKFSFKDTTYFAKIIKFPSSVTMTGSDVANFKTAYGWGDHSGVYYAKADTGSVLLSRTRAASTYATKTGVVEDSDFSSNGIMKRTGSGTYSILTDNSTNWDLAVTKLNDTITLGDVALLIEDSTVSWPSIYQMNAALALKAPLASPTFTGGAVGLTNSTYTGTLYFGSKSTALSHSAGDEGYYNVFVGYNSGVNMSSGSYNVGVGDDIMTYTTIAVNNCALGYGSLHGITTTGTDNVGMGYNAGTSISTGDFNTAVGSGSAFNITTGLYNTAIGAQAGFTGNKNYGVFLGFKAGYYETGDNKLFIDNGPRTNEADGRIKALIYGVFDANTSNQAITFNALAVYLPYLPTYADNAAATGGGLTAGQVYKTSTGVLMIVY